MAPPQLLPELWEIVISHLTHEAPLALSNPPRSSLKQHDLSSLMRLVQSVARAHLYETVTTDELPLLLREIYSPSMQLNTSCIKSLRVEYCEKGQESSYTVLLGSPNPDSWHSIGRTASKQKSAISKECDYEARRMAYALQFAQRAKLLSRAFSQLRVSAVSSIYGKVDERWRWHAEKYTPSDPTLSWANKCGGLFDELLGGCKNLQHICIRDPNGPLSLPLITHATYLPKCHYSRNVHFDELVDSVYIPFGSPVTYTSDAPPTIDWLNLSGALSTCFDKQVAYRSDKWTADGQYRDPKDPADITIYCSTATLDPKSFTAEQIAEASPPGTPGPFVATTFPGRAIPHPEQAKLAKEAGEGLQEQMRDASQLEDHIRWFPSYETPQCPACGSGPP